MRYVYAHLGSDWAVTILATDVQERSALSEDTILLTRRRVVCFPLHQ